MPFGQIVSSSSKECQGLVRLCIFSEQISEQINQNYFNEFRTSIITGKTITIVGLLKFLTRMGKKVLVTAYTGTAVDNILIKCYDKKLDNFIRVGEPKIRGLFIRFNI